MNEPTENGGPNGYATDGRLPDTSFDWDNPNGLSDDELDGSAIYPSELTREMNKQYAIHHQRWGRHLRWEMTQEDASYSPSECEIKASEHYAAARTYIGIKEEDQFYA